MNVYLASQYWTLDIHTGLYSECLLCYLDIGHWTFSQVCTVNVYLASQYWTLDIHIGLYSECLLCYLEIGHWTFTQVQWVSSLLFRYWTFTNGRYSECPFFRLEVAHWCTNPCECPMSNIKNKSRSSLYKPMWMSNVQYKNKSTHSLYKPMWMSYVQYETSLSYNFNASWSIQPSIKLSEVSWGGFHKKLRLDFRPFLGLALSF